jgi:hypothetical protein
MKKHHVSSRFNRKDLDTVSESIGNIKNPLVSTRFYKYLNLVRDQQAGGSNPYAPIQRVRKIQPVSDLLRNGL